MSKEEKEKKVTKKSDSSKKNSSRLENKGEEKKNNQVKKETRGKENTSKKEGKNSSEKSNNTISKKKVTTKKIEEVVEEEVIEKNVDIDSDLEDFGETSFNGDDSSKEKKAKKLKKSDLILIIGLIIVVVLGCFLMKGQKDEPSYQLPLTLEGEAGLQLLSYSDYQKKIDNNESFVVILSRESCSHCANFMPVAKEFASSKNLPMYYVDTDTFTEEEWSSFEKSNTFLKKNGGNWGTPTTIVLAGKEAVDYIEGETTADKLQELYDKYFDLKQE